MYGSKCIIFDCKDTAAYATKLVTYKRSGRKAVKILTRPTVPDEQLNLCLRHAERMKRDREAVLNND